MKTVVGLRDSAEKNIKSKVPDAPQVRAEMSKSQDLSIVLEDQERAANKIQKNPSADLKSMIENVNDLVKAAVDTEVAFFIDNYNLRKALANVNNVHEAQLKSVNDQLKKTKDDLVAVQKTHEEVRVDITDKLDTTRRESNQRETELAAIQGTLAEERSKLNTVKSDLSGQVKKLQEDKARKEEVLDVKDGTISFVDYSTKQLRIDVNRSMGVRPTMRFTVFDKKAVGIPSDKPKGQIEVTEVGNQYSIGRIIETRDLAKPIVAGDLIYSAGWNASDPQKFALIGKLDLDQDGKDDRADLKRMIASAGGTVVYDLNMVSGKEQEIGKLTGQIAWYVDDVRALTPQQIRDLSLADREFIQHSNQMLIEARSLGIRPLPLTRLPGILGYSMRNLRTSPVEGVDKSGLRDLANPSGKAIQPKAEEPKPEASTPAEEPAPLSPGSESANPAKPVD
jgi:hypothetical protein